MMLRIGRKIQIQQNKLGRRGYFLSIAAFTLIELIIVAAIILMLVAVSSPRFRSTFSDLELKDSSYSIGKIIKYAQKRAILEERKYRVIFDFENQSYRLLVESVDGFEGDGEIMSRFGLEIKDR